MGTISETEAAFARLHDEVERVRAQVRIERHELEERADTFRSAARRNGSDAFDLEAEVERLRAERDAARRELIEHGHGITPRGIPTQYVPEIGRRLPVETIAECARSRGWGYLVEKVEAGR